MTNQGKPVRQTTVVLLAFGLIVGLLPGFASAQDLSTQAARTARAGAIVPLDGPVLAGKPVTFKLSGNPSNPHWDLGDGATAGTNAVLLDFLFCLLRGGRIIYRSSGSSGA